MLSCTPTNAMPSRRWGMFASIAMSTMPVSSGSASTSWRKIEVAPASTARRTASAMSSCATAMCEIERNPLRSHVS